MTVRGCCLLQPSHLLSIIALKFQRKATSTSPNHQQSKRYYPLSTAMDTPPTLLFKPPPPFPAPSRTFDVSPLEFVLALFAVITIPTLIYTFFLFIKCPPNPFRPRRPSSGGLAAELPSRQQDNKGNLEQVSGVKYRKEIHVKDIGSECPVCLSVFVDGEEIRQLTVCKHSFHSSCVDIWLSSHASCPVCRASVAVKASDRPSVAGVAGEADLRQGLPDSASLV